MSGPQNVHFWQLSDVNFLQCYILTLIYKTTDRLSGTPWSQSTKQFSIEPPL